ncbi:MAG TPA: cation:proton antiporter [Candidatus Acidoferrales bacterium]|nr:cation:proton antiporter [Candidatus Acidoferrales bacterium]
MPFPVPALFIAQAESTAQHGDPVAPVLIALMLIAVGASLGGHWMKKLGQPAVLGELLIGMVAANVAYYFREPVITVVREGPTMLAIINAALAQNLSLADAAEKILTPGPHTERLVDVLRSAAAPMAVTVFSFIDQLSRVAVIILLFLVGLETSVHEMGKVGLAAFLVAVIGVVCPFLLGIGLMAWLTPGAPLQKDIFIGAILTATSVGITARVFRDLQQSQRTEAKIILGAAVIDDVLGLVILAVVSGLVVTGSVSLLSVSIITLKAVVFLAVAIGAGMWTTQRMVRRLARLELDNVKLLFGLGFAFLLSWLANSIGLATIVGAFAAGLVLEEFFLEELKGHTLRDALAPLETLVVPVFFVLMGMQVKLESFADRQVVVIAALLTAVAIAGKLVAGLGCSPKLDRLSIGVGMMPRGEVGLIFASIGKGLGVVSDALFSAVVIMVMVTTLLAPPLLKITLARSERRAE